MRPFPRRPDTAIPSGPMWSRAKNAARAGAARSTIVICRCGSRTDHASQAMVAGTRAIGPAHSVRLLLHDPRDRSVGPGRGVSARKNRLGNLAKWGLDCPANSGNARLLPAAATKLVDRAGRHGARNRRRMGSATSERRRHLDDSHHRLRLRAKFPFAFWIVLLRLVPGEPGTSAGTGAFGRNGRALHALSGRLVADMEVVSERGRLAAPGLVPRLRAGRIGDSDKGAAGPAVLRRFGFALLSDHRPQAATLVPGPPGRPAHRPGDRRAVAGSLRNQDGAVGIGADLFSRRGPAVL